MKRMICINLVGIKNRVFIISQFLSINQFITPMIQRRRPREQHWPKLIVVRNSIILVDFINLKLAEGKALEPSHENVIWFDRDGKHAYFRQRTPPGRR